jgi:hypothetical protein
MPRKNGQHNQICKMKKEHARGLSLQGGSIEKEQWHRFRLAVHGSI